MIPGKQETTARILRVEHHTSDVFTLFVDWDFEAFPVQPGQFFQLESSKKFRRPISVSHIGETLGLTIKVMGEGTAWLSAREAGETIRLFGPLGRGFDLETGAKHPLVIGGGIGIAPMIPVAKALGAKALLGYAKETYLEEQFDVAEIWTEQPTAHNHGRVTAPLSQMKGIDMIYACGPNPMLEAIGIWANEQGIPAQLLLEEHMACGVGACLVCTCETTKFKRVCKDGPMFYASELDFTQSTVVRSVGSAPVADTDLRVDLGGLLLKNPVTTASGTFGFGEEYGAFYDVSKLGAIAVKGITLEPRTGNPGRRMIETPAGMINSVGLQNAGIDAFLTHELPRLRGIGTKVIVNINGNTLEEYEEIARRTAAAGVDSIELNISCPNVKAGGLAFGTSTESVERVVRAVRQVTEGTHLIVKLTPNVTSIAEIARAAEAGGADALSLINTVSGMAIDIHSRKKILLRGNGGLSGPAVKPIAVRLVSEVHGASTLPILGMGGIERWEDAVEFLLAGASAVAIGTGNFVNPYAPLEVLDGITRYLKANGFASVRDIVGIAN